MRSRRESEGLAVGYLQVPHVSVEPLHALLKQVEPLGVDFFTGRDERLAHVSPFTRGVELAVTDALRRLVV